MISFLWFSDFSFWNPVIQMLYFLDLTSVSLSLFSLPPHTQFSCFLISDVADFPKLIILRFLLIFLIGLNSMVAISSSKDVSVLC